MHFYDFEAVKMNGQAFSMKEFEGKVVIVVNTASRCGLTPQFEGLEQLYQTYHDQGLEIIGFPCNQFANQDPGSNEEISSFCQLNYGVSFTMCQKVDVNGDKAHPLFQFLTQQQATLGKRIKWNFTKFVIDRQGRVVKRFAPTTKPEKMKDLIEQLL